MCIYTVRSPLINATVTRICHATNYPTSCPTDSLIRYMILFQAGSETTITAMGTESAIDNSPFCMFSTN